MKVKSMAGKLFSFMCLESSFVVSSFCLASLRVGHRLGTGVEMAQPFYYFYFFFLLVSFEETKPGVSQSDWCARREEPLASWRLSTNHQGKSLRLPTRRRHFCAALVPLWRTPRWCLWSGVSDEHSFIKPDGLQIIRGQQQQNGLWYNERILHVQPLWIDSSKRPSIQSTRT